MSKYHCSQCSKKHSKYDDDSDGNYRANKYYANNCYANQYYDNFDCCCAVGEKGDKGNRGDQGFPGATGATGPEGPPGPESAQIVSFGASVSLTEPTLLEAYLVPWNRTDPAVPSLGFNTNQLHLTAASPTQTLLNGTYTASNPVATVTLMSPISITPLGDTTLTLGTLVPTGGGLTQSFIASNLTVVIPNAELASVSLGGVFQWIGTGTHTFNAGDRLAVQISGDHSGTIALTAGIEFDFLLTRV